MGRQVVLSSAPCQASPRGGGRGANRVLGPQEEYLREQIEWKEIPFSDNQPCIDLISQKPYGILRILDDQSCFPQVRGCPVPRQQGQQHWVVTVPRVTPWPRAALLLGCPGQSGRPPGFLWAGQAPRASRSVPPEQLLPEDLLLQELLKNRSQLPYKREKGGCTLSADGETEAQSSRCPSLCSCSVAELRAGSGQLSRHPHPRDYSPRPAEQPKPCLTLVSVPRPPTTRSSRSVTTTMG